MSATAVPPIAEAIPFSLSDSSPDLLKWHYSFLNLQVPVTDSMLLRLGSILNKWTRFINRCTIILDTKRRYLYG